MKFGDTSKITAYGERLDRGERRHTRSSEGTKSGQELVLTYPEMGCCHLNQQILLWRNKVPNLGVSRMALWKQMGTCKMKIKMKKCKMLKRG